MPSLPSWLLVWEFSQVSRSLHLSIYRPSIKVPPGYYTFQPALKSLQSDKEAKKAQQYASLFGIPIYSPLTEPETEYQLKPLEKTPLSIPSPFKIPALPREIPGLNGSGVLRKPPKLLLLMRALGMIEVTTSGNTSGWVKNGV